MISFMAQLAVEQAFLKYNDWKLCEQDNPHETLIFSEAAHMAITRDKIFGWRVFPLESKYVKQCAWQEIGAL